MFRGLLALAFVLPLAGCIGQADVRHCPRTSILGIAAEAEVYRANSGRDVTDLEFNLEILGLTVECAPGKDKVTTQLSIAIGGEKGPAARGDAWVSYFIAVVERASERVLDKQTHRGRLSFGQDQRRTVAIEEWEQVIPLPKGKLGKDYEIIVGLNLSPEELDAVRRRRSE